MKRLTAAVALVLCSVAPAGAHPGHGAESVTIDGDAFRYAPAEVTVGVRDSVIWFWRGVVSRDHSVTADPGQTEAFDSDPGGPPTNQTHPAGDLFSHTFREEGRFTYHCKVHEGMTGVVNVVAVPGISAHPLRLSGIRVSTHGDEAEARFRLSKRADLVARISEWRKPHWRGVKTINANGRKGRNEIELPAGPLGPGRYRLTLNAYDDQNRRASGQEPFSIKG